jgi:hypothetical protein
MARGGRRVRRSGSNWSAFRRHGRGGRPIAAKRRYVDPLLPLGSRSARHRVEQSALSFRAMKPSAIGSPSAPEGWYEFSRFRDITCKDDATLLMKEAARIGPWILDFVCVPLDTTGERLVCPALPRSIEKGLLFCAVSATTTTAIGELTSEILGHRAAYLNYRATLSLTSQGMMALIVVFPLLIPRFFPLLDTVKSSQNDLFTSDGLAARGFFPGNPDRSLRNPAVPIAQSTIPAFAIRPIQWLDGADWDAFSEKAK